MEDYIILERNIMDGVQKLYKFENGYGASVVKHAFSYGGGRDLWEMALIVFEPSENNELSWMIAYRDDFANGDVAGELNDQEVLEWLEWIQSLEDWQSEEIEAH